MNSLVGIALGQVPLIKEPHSEEALVPSSKTHSLLLLHQTQPASLVQWSQVVNIEHEGSGEQDSAEVNGSRQ